MLRAQDILILLKIISRGKDPWKGKDLADELYISTAEVSLSLNRCVKAGLLSENKKTVYRQSLMEFIQYAIPYLFPVLPGAMANGILTGHSYPVIAEQFHPELKYVWPDATAYDRGLSIEPIYKTVVKAVKKDTTLYRLLALIDVLRVGRVREKKVAINELKKIILDGAS